MLELDSKRGQTGADRALARRIATYLFARGIVDLKGLQIKVDGGIVILQGQVASPQERALCLNCCQRVAGVLHVIDELSVNADVAPRRPLQRASKSANVPK